VAIERRVTLMIYLAVSTLYRHATDRWTDRQTSCDSIIRAMHTHRAVKTYQSLLLLSADRSLIQKSLWRAERSLTNQSESLYHQTPLVFYRATQCKCDTASLPGPISRKIENTNARSTLATDGMSRVSWRHARIKLLRWYTAWDTLQLRRQ